MKTKTWVLILTSAALVLGAICLWQFMGRQNAGFAEILVDGTPIKTIDLSVDQSFTVEGVGGFNRIVVEHGSIRVAEADCKGNDCVKSGARSSGVPIICLPHRVVIRFVDSGGIDGLSG